MNTSWKRTDIYSNVDDECCTIVGFSLHVFDEGHDLHTNSRNGTNIEAELRYLHCPRVKNLMVDANASQR